jgi:integrase
MHAYVALRLATGIRTEEARALRWQHVDFGDLDARPPVPAKAAVWRSVRAHGDTKTEKSRRTLGLPEMAVDALRAHKKRQAGNGSSPERSGAIKILSSAHGQAVPSTRLTSGGSSGESARPPGSGSTGRHVSYVIHLCH